MKHNDQTQQVSRFNIIFEKLDEAKQQYGYELTSDLETASEANKTIALFKEFQESASDFAYITITRS